jgi:hypothetical protein
MSTAIGNILATALYIYDSVLSNFVTVQLEPDLMNCSVGQARCSLTTCGQALIDAIASTELMELQLESWILSALAVLH